MSEPAGQGAGAPDGGNNALEVKYVVVWRKQGDQWRWLVDIWNTSS